jgi:hypothetical protein
MGISTPLICQPKGAYEGEVSVAGQHLCKDISQVVHRFRMHNLDIAVCDALPDEVLTYVDVLDASMAFCVDGKRHRTHIIAMEYGGAFLGHIELPQENIDKP